MPTIYDIDPQKLIEKTVPELKKVIKMPEWGHFVKTGVSKDRQPTTDDWYYFRAASVLRRVYMFGPMGTNKLRWKYGSKKNRGKRPEKFFRASGKIIRTILQQLEKAELVKHDKKGSHHGRVITPKGKSMLDKLSNPKNNAGQPRAESGTPKAVRVEEAS